MKHGERERETDTNHEEKGWEESYEVMGPERRVRLSRR